MSLWILQPDGAGNCCACGVRQNPCDTCSICQPLFVFNNPSNGQHIVPSIPTGIVAKDISIPIVYPLTPPNYPGSISFSNNNSTISVFTNPQDVIFQFDGFNSTIIPSIFSFVVNTNTGEFITVYTQSSGPAQGIDPTTNQYSLNMILGSNSLFFINSSGNDGINPILKNTNSQFFPNNLPITFANNQETIYGFSQQVVQGNNIGHENVAMILITGINPLEFSVSDQIATTNSSPPPSILPTTYTIMNMLFNAQMIQFIGSIQNYPSACINVSLTNGGSFTLQDINGNPIDLTTRITKLDIQPNLP